MKFFALLSAFGLATATAAYCATFWGIDPRDVAPGLVFLPVGTFLVLFPALAIAPKTRKGNRRSLNEAVAWAPKWLKALTVALIINMAANFIASGVAGGGGAHRQADGKFVVSEHGRIIRYITAEEYGRLIRYECRVIDSLSMALYCVSLTLFVSEIRRKPPGRCAPQVPGEPLFSIPSHKSILVLLIFFGWLCYPFLMETLVLPRFGEFSPVWSTVLLIASAIFGVIVPPWLWRKRVASRCPRCGGRAYCCSLAEMNYRCDDCNHI
jgi:hypothetical protein